MSKLQLVLIVMVLVIKQSMVETKDESKKTGTNHKSQVLGEIVVFTILLLMLVTCYGWFCLKPSPYDVTKNPKFKTITNETSKQTDV